MRLVRGFTLLEVLVAIGIISLIGVLIYAAFAGMSRSRNSIIHVADRYQAGRQAMQRMSRELSSAYMSGHKNFLRKDNPHATGFIGVSSRPDRVDFTAFAHLRLTADRHESDQTEIGYYCQRNRDTGRLDLVRRAAKHIDIEPTKGGLVETMVDDVEEFEIKYLDPITNEWLQTWDSTQAAAQYGRLPAQVWIVLVLANGPGGQRIRFEQKISIPIMLPLTYATD
jgi:general secretion pathway protein J